MLHLVVASAHELVAERIESYFSKRGFRVDITTDVDNCLDRLRQRIPDALILDDGLPAGGAVSVLNGLPEASREKLAIVLLTDDLGGDGQAQGWVRQLVKRPTDVQALFEAVRQVVPKRAPKKRDKGTSSDGP